MATQQHPDSSGRIDSPVARASDGVAALRPATELPFRAINDPTGQQDPFYWAIAGGGGYLDASRTSGFELTSHMRPEDARYIVHAANNYPKLVEALRNYVEALSVPLHKAVLDGTTGRELLRELGEL